MQQFTGRLAHFNAPRTPPATAAVADPPVLHTVATQYGRAIAAGEITPETARIGLARICLYHPDIGINRMDDALGRAITTCDRATYADEAQAAQDIRLGIQPLLDRRAPTAAIRAEAYRLSAARLLRHDCDAIVSHELAKRLGRDQSKAKRVA